MKGNTKASRGAARASAKHRTGTGLAPLPLFEYAARKASPPIRATLIYLPNLCDAEGQPRPALLIPGRRLPVAFRTMAAALAAQRAAEVRA